jgi:hypothetical protein
LKLKILHAHWIDEQCLRENGEIVLWAQK